jgi:hypothetical protein
VPLAVDVDGPAGAILFATRDDEEGPGLGLWTFEVVSGAWVLTGGLLLGVEDYEQCNAMRVPPWVRRWSRTS